MASISPNHKRGEGTHCSPPCTCWAFRCLDVLLCMCDLFPPTARAVTTFYLILFDKCSESSDPVPGTALSPLQILTHSGLHNHPVKKVPSLVTLPQEETAWAQLGSSPRSQRLWLEPRLLIPTCPCLLPLQRSGAIWQLWGDPHGLPVTAHPSLHAPGPAWESHSVLSNSTDTKLTSRKLFSPPPLPVLDSVHPSHFFALLSASKWTYNLSSNQRHFECEKVSC